MNHAETYKNNILVVDDSPDTLKVLSRILTWQGYIVRPVLNAEFALKTICENPPDLILLDIMLPGMSGYEFCQHLKTVEQTRNIPVVFMSALHESGDKVRAFQLGGVDYITKPFQVEEVLARVAMHLKLRNMHKQLQEQNMNLQQEIAERKRIEQALWQHNRDLSLFNEMSESLQMCRTEADTYEMIAKMCTRLFPADSGYIALIDEAHQMVSEVASWGEYPSSPRRVFPLKECKRLRHGEVSVIEDSDPEEWCVRLSQSIRQGQQCLCVPISTAEEMLGVFSLQISHYEPTITDPQQTRKSALQRMLVIRLVEHYALILINLRLREKLRLASIRDALTGLYNRRYMEEVLQQMVNHAKRHHTSLALIMLDIDHFKTFNDTYGHEAGDVVLQALGTMLQANFRDEDVACRYGGEEFLLILPDATVGSGQKRAEGLLLNVRSLQIPYQETTLQITISIGVAALPDHGFDIHQLVSAADTAMYQAKQCGRNQVVVASS